MFELLSGDLIVCLRDLNITSIVLRFTLSILFGGIIGIERGKKLRAAGMRTHIVVCMGAASVMMVSQYITLVTKITSDPARLGAQVISGIGFLGVGTIVVTGHKQVKGLTTAAGLWASACMGLAIGVGFYEGAVVMVISLYMVLEVLDRMDEKYLKNVNKINVYIEYVSGMRFSIVIKKLRQKGWQVVAIEEVNAGGNDCTSMILALSHNFRNVDQGLLLEELREVEGVLFVEKI